MAALIRFDVFELDANSYQLRRGGQPVDLPPQSLRVLTLLAARPNELVTRNEIKRTLWPDELYGNFDSRLNFAVKKLREAIGDSAERPRYIQTERKAGYRFIASVHGARELPSRGTVLPAPESTARSVTRSGGRRALFLALIAMASVAAIGSFIMRGHGANPASTYQAAIQPLPASTDDSRPEISEVTPISPEARQRIVIRGTGFGFHVPFSNTDSPYLAIRDVTAGWAAGRLVSHNWDEVMVDVESWNENEIVLSGFSGEYGAKGWKLTEGDAMEIAIWNPENGAGPTLYHLTVTSRKHI